MGILIIDKAKEAKRMTLGELIDMKHYYIEFYVTNASRLSKTMVLATSETEAKDKLHKLYNFTRIVTCEIL